MANHIVLIWVSEKQKYFCQGGWTGVSRDSPPGKSVGSLPLSPCGRGCIGGLRPPFLDRRTPMLCIGFGCEASQTGEGSLSADADPSSVHDTSYRGHLLPQGEK